MQKSSLLDVASTGLLDQSLKVVVQNNYGFESLAKQPLVGCGQQVTCLHRKQPWRHNSHRLPDDDEADDHETGNVEGDGGGDGGGDDDCGGDGGGVDDGGGCW